MGGGGGGVIIIPPPPPRRRNLLPTMWNEAFYFIGVEMRYTKLDDK